MYMATSVRRGSHDARRAARASADAAPHQPHAERVRRFALQTPRLALHQILQHPGAPRECDECERWKIARFSPRSARHGLLARTVGRDTARLAGRLPGQRRPGHRSCRHWRPMTGLHRRPARPGPHEHGQVPTRRDAAAGSGNTVTGASGGSTGRTPVVVPSGVSPPRRRLEPLRWRWCVRSVDADVRPLEGEPPDALAPGRRGGALGTPHAWRGRARWRRAQRRLREVSTRPRRRSLVRDPS